MDGSDVVPQVFADNKLYLQSLGHQGFPSSHCIAPMQSTPTVYPYMYLAQHTMPSHGTPGLQDGQLQTSTLITEGVHASQQHLNPTLQQNTCKPGVQAPLGYTQMLRPVATPGVTHGLLVNQDHEAKLLSEVPLSAPFNRESSQNSRAPVLTRRLYYPFHQELNRSGDDRPGYSGRSPPVHVFGQHTGDSGIQCSSSNVPFRPNLGPHDINFIRKLRKREQNAQNMWKQRERVHGKRNQMSLEEDSYDELPPSKQFISEEKMAARMSNLRITGDNKMSTLEKRWMMASKDAKRHLAEIESRLSDSESDIESDLECNESGDRNGIYNHIEVSPELKTALSQKKGPLPDSIIKSM